MEQCLAPRRCSINICGMVQPKCLSLWHDEVEGRVASKINTISTDSNSPHQEAEGLRELGAAGDTVTQTAAQGDTGPLSANSLTSCSSQGAPTPGFLT